MLLVLEDTHETSAFADHVPTRSMNTDSVVLVSIIATVLLVACGPSSVAEGSDESSPGTRWSPSKRSPGARALPMLVSH